MARCGYRTGVIKDASRSNWQNDGDRPIAWSAWYPTNDVVTVEPPGSSFFDMGDVSCDAALAEAHKFPVVLMSHGTGGIAESTGWLARTLVRQGYVVIAPNHHGNSGLKPYCAEGFLCWWERAADLSILLTDLASDGFFAGRLDIERVFAIGFSLGGYAVLALAGARTSMDVFNVWGRANAITSGGPKEFPDAADSLPELFETSQAFRTSWARHGDDFNDPRVTSVVALAPAPPVRAFTATSVRQIQVPVTLVTGGADLEAPSAHCADWLVRQNTDFQRYDLGSNVGHYTFLEQPFDRNLIGKLDIFSDQESVDRTQVHQMAAGLVVKAFEHSSKDCSARG